MNNISAVLTKTEIQELLSAKPPLIENMPDSAAQIQPNGIDITVKEIAMLSSSGIIALENKDRVISITSQLVFDGLGRLDLLAGCYLVTCNEIINIPKNLMALAQPRSSLLRCGIGIHNAVWDAGYSGRSQALMVVYNPKGFRIYKDARFLQLVFFRLNQEVNEGYQGIFQQENIE